MRCLTYSQRAHSHGERKEGWYGSVSVCSSGSTPEGASTWLTMPTLCLKGWPLLSQVGKVLHIIMMTRDSGFIHRCGFLFVYLLFIFPKSWARGQLFNPPKVGCLQQGHFQAVCWMWMCVRVTATPNGLWDIVSFLTQNLLGSDIWKFYSRR